MKKEAKGSKYTLMETFTLANSKITKSMAKEYSIGSI